MVPEIEMEPLTSPTCMQRRWGSRVTVEPNSPWDSSKVHDAVMVASARSTATRQFAAEAEFEGVLHASETGMRNRPEDMPRFVAVMRVEKADHLRVVEVPPPSRTGDSEGNGL